MNSLLLYHIFFFLAETYQKFRRSFVAFWFIGFKLQRMTSASLCNYVNHTNLLSSIYYNLNPLFTGTKYPEKLIHTLIRTKIIILDIPFFSQKKKRMTEPDSRSDSGQIMKWRSTRFYFRPIFHYRNIYSVNYFPQFYFGCLLLFQRSIFF